MGDKDKKKTAEPQKAADEAALVTKGETALAVADFGEFQKETGFDNQTGADVALPWLVVMQDLSPLVKERKAQPGQILHTATGKLYDGNVGIELVIAITDHNYGEWVPRKKGGGFRGIHPLRGDVVLEALKRHAALPDNQREFGKYTTQEGNELVEAFYTYGVICNGARAVGPFAMAWASMKIKPYRAFMGRAQGHVIQSPITGEDQKVPLFGILARLTTAPQRNAKGDFHNAVLSAAVDDDLVKSTIGPDDRRFQEAYQIYKLHKAGTLKVDVAGQDGGQGTAAGNGEDIPF